jgi:hypothetical protein
MFERYDAASRRAVFFARYEACARGAQAIAPEHLLLGMLRQEADWPSDAWPSSVVPVAEAHDRLKGSLVRRPSKSPSMTSH